MGSCIPCGVNPDKKRRTVVGSEKEEGGPISLGDLPGRCGKGRGKKKKKG